MTVNFSIMKLIWSISRELEKKKYLIKWSWGQEEQKSYSEYGNQVIVISRKVAGYASETISKVSNHYESSTIAKQVAASQVEKIPLDYECPKRSTGALEPAIQTSKEFDLGNCKPISEDGNGTGEVAAISVIETTFGEEAIATESSQPSA